MKILFHTALILLPVLACAHDERIDLEPMIVEGSALEQTLPAELAAYGAELEVLEREELDRTGVSDVGQALQGTTPGLFVSPKTGRSDYVDVSLQGSRSADVLWLVDGVRINNRLFGGTTPLDSISTHMIERIEVLKGGQGLFYGTQAVAGVVNIVLRSPGDESGGAVTGAVGSLGDRRLAGHASGQGAAGRWLVFGEQDHSDGYRPYRDAAYQDNAREVDRGFSRRSFGGRYHLPAGDNASLQLLWIRNDVEADDPRPANNFKSVNDRDENIVSLKWDHQVTERSGYFFKAYWHDWWTDHTRMGMDTNGNVNVINDRERWGYDDYGFNLKGRHVTAGGSEILGGVDYQSYEGEDFLLRIDGKAETVTAGFVQFRPMLDFSPSTHLALGARYNHADFGGDHSIGHVSLGQPLPGGLELKAHAGTNFRLPSAFELFVTDPSFPAGNENLDPESSTNTNLALSGPLGSRVQWRLGAFYREIEDLIRVDNGTYRNSDELVRVRGGEAGLELGGERGWQLELHGTRARARARDSNRQIDGIPQWFVQAALAREGDHGGWKLSLRHTGDRVTTLSDFGPQPLGHTTVVDGNVWYRFGRERRNRVTLRVENLGDRDYANRISQATQPNGDPFRYETLGVPRNVQLEYSRSF